MNAAQHNAVLAHFTERAKNFGLKPGSKRFLDAQAHYFCGAMATENAITGNSIDAGITITIMTGRTVEPRKE